MGRELGTALTYFIIGLILVIAGGMLAILMDKDNATRGESDNKQNNKQGK